MTHQFKFGDLVLWDINPSPFVFMGVSKIDPDLAWIRADNDLPYFAPFGELKPVPHPDTVRLDWIGKQRATLYHNAREDIKYGGIAPVEVKAGVQSEYFGGSTVRQAIDAAMRQEAV